MDELDLEARRLVELARLARTPDMDARRRVAARVAQVVGAATAASATAATAKAAASAEVLGAAGQSAATASSAAATAGQAAGSAAFPIGSTGVGSTGVLGGKVAAAAAGASVAPTAAGLGAGAAVKAAGTVAGLGVLKWAGVAVVLSAGVVTGAIMNTAHKPAAVPAVVAPALPPRATEPARAPQAPQLAELEAIGATPDGEPEAPAVELHPRATQPARAAKRFRKREQPAPAVNSLQADLDLLHSARAAWEREDARGALRMLRRHRALFPDSALSLERQALLSLCLCDLGRDGEAARVAKAFLRAAPESPLRSAVVRSCVGEPE